MPFQSLTTLPTAPSRDDTPEVFIEKADAWVAAVQALVPELNTLTSQIAATAALIAVAPAYADPGLLALTGNTPAADRLPYFNGSSSSALATLTAAGRALLDDADASAQLTTLGLSANGKSLVTAADYAAMRTLLGLVIGTNVQAQSAVLAAYAAGASPTAAFLSLADDADAAAMRTTLGIGAAISFGATADGSYLSIPVGARTYYIQWGKHTSGSNGWSSSYVLPVTYTTEGEVIACSTELGTSANDGNKISATLDSLGSFKIGSDDFSIIATWISWGY